MVKQKTVTSLSVLQMVPMPRFNATKARPGTAGVSMRQEKRLQEPGGEMDNQIAQLVSHVLPLKGKSRISFLMWIKNTSLFICLQFTRACVNNHKHI